MSPFAATIVVFFGLGVAIWVGRQLRRLVSEKLSEETRDTVKLATGLIATMTALLLGLLVSSSKATYDGAQTQVVQMAAKVAFLDRLLSLYGPEAAEVRTQFRTTVEETVRRLWPSERSKAAELMPNQEAGDSIYLAIQRLSPQGDGQQKLKALIEAGIVDVAQLRTLLVAQSQSALSLPMVIIVVCWLVVIFINIALLSPANATATISLLMSAMAVAGAMFLLLELDRPFEGMIRIPHEEMVARLAQLQKQKGP